MASAVAITPASGSITSKMTVCKVNVTGAAVNDASTFDADNSPSEDPILYYLKAHKTGQDALVSQRFTPNADGLFEWDSLVFPAAGTWTLDLCLDADDSADATRSVVVA